MGSVGHIAFLCLVIDGKEENLVNERIIAGNVNLNE